jgi:hypothetical protein
MMSFFDEYYVRKLYIQLKGNPNHDNHGRFSSSSGGHITISAKYKNPEDMPSIQKYMQEGVPDEMSDDYVPTPGDSILQDMYRDQGFDGKPHLVSDSELDAHIKNGEEELYRGMEGGKGYGQQYQFGDHFPGYGVYGNGTYTTMTTPEASQSSFEVAKTYGKDVLRMSVIPEAKIVSKERLDREHRDYMAQLGEKYKVTKDPKIKNLMLCMIDKGRFSVARGYDGIYVERGKNIPFVVMHNRTMTRVQKTIINGE